MRIIGLNQMDIVKPQPIKNKNTENFPVGSFLIAPHLRPHIHAYYNFARMADDIGDDPLMDAHDKIKRLTQLENVVSGKADDLVVAVRMRESLETTKITAQHCVDLLRAFKQDAVKRRYHNQNELLEYCRYSASPVGRYVLALHGIGQTAWPANDALCTVLQIINHIQDCADDYREVDRVYLPLDDMMKVGASPSDLSKAKTSEAMRKVIDMQLARLQPMMVQARELPRKVPNMRLKLETSIIHALAESLIKLLEKRDPLCDTVKLSKPALFGAVLNGIVRAFF
jgi:hydroxysqualene synthase